MATIVLQVCLEVDEVSEDAPENVRSTVESAICNSMLQLGEDGVSTFNVVFEDIV